MPNHHLEGLQEWGIALWYACPQTCSFSYKDTIWIPSQAGNPAVSFSSCLFQKVMWRWQTRWWEGGGWTWGMHEGRKAQRSKSNPPIYCIFSKKKNHSLAIWWSGGEEGIYPGEHGQTSESDSRPAKTPEARCLLVQARGCNWLTPEPVHWRQEDQVRNSEGRSKGGEISFSALFLFPAWKMVLGLDLV